LDEDNTRLLEFGCGQGVLAMQLCQHVASYTGIDASSGAAARLNERFIHQGLEPGEAKAYSFDVHHSNQEGQASIVDIEPVDCIVASMVHHHLSDPASTTQLLIHRYLKPGGKIAIIDL
ncbi:S-adenosyl-L-methionine-dependent methyltransferase, partial [Piptocephalis cylindrospora]